MGKKSELLQEIKDMRNLLKKIDNRLENIERNFKDDDIKELDIDIDNIWNKAKDIIKCELTEVSFNTWLEPIVEIETRQNIIYLQVPNNFSKSILEARYMDLIRNAICHVTDKSLSVEFIIEDLKLEEHADYNNKYLPESKYTFENTIIGKENELSYKTILSFIKNLDEKPQLLYLYGEIGVGKTHIIQAIANQSLENNKHLDIGYITTDEFTDGLIESIRNDNKDFRKLLLKKDLLIIDDFQALIGKERTQEEFHIIFKELKKLGKSMVISSKKSPEEIRMSESNFNCIYEIDKLVEIVKPNLETRIEILKFRLSQENIEIEYKYIKAIANECSKNINELINGLNKHMHLVVK